MRITEVESIVLRLPSVADVCDGSQDAFVVRVHTDAGIIGLGEADSMPSVLKAVFEARTSNSIGHGLRDVLLGQDPLQLEPLWQRMYDRTLYLGGAGVRLAAISGAEMALWDIAGKVAGRPVYDLLGGAFRRRLRTYASVLFPEDATDVDSVRRTAERLRQEGYTAMKFGWGGFGAERARALAEFRLYWLEAPMPHEPVEAYAELCSASPVRIACESPGGFWESLHFLRRGRPHVILPDVSNVGGLSQWKRVAQAARTEGAWCVPHNFSTGILTAASLHLVANQPDTDLVECSEAGSPLNTDLVRPALRPRDGYITLPDAPGLGVELDDAIVERYRVS